MDLTRPRTSFSAHRSFKNTSNLLLDILILLRLTDINENATTKNYKSTNKQTVFTLSTAKNMFIILFM